MYVHLWTLFLIVIVIVAVTSFHWLYVHYVQSVKSCHGCFSKAALKCSVAMRSLIQMISIMPIMTMRTIFKYRLGQTLVQLASDTVMFLGIMHSAANQGVRELAATML